MKATAAVGSTDSPRDMKRFEKKLLTISPYGTYVPNTGGTKRIHYLNRGYAIAGWDVLQVSGASVRQGVRDLLARRDPPVAPRYREEVYFNPLVVVANRVLRGRNAPQVAASLIPRFLRPSIRLAREVSRHRVILFEHPHSFDMASALLTDDHFVVLDAHNIESRLYVDQLDEEGLAGTAARALLELERRCMARADLIFACSATDRDIAIAEFDVDPARIHVAPNGVDLASTPYVSEDDRAQAKRLLGLNGATALFVGSRWPPNTEAAFNILSMARSHPDISFLVVGAAGESLPDERPGNLIVAGRVDDLAPWYAAADVAVNPMQSGSGSNVKMFEYFASGLPTVSTPIGARGVDDPEGLAVHVCELAEIPQRVIALAASKDLAVCRQSARALAERKYDWSAIAAGISATIESALEARER